MKQIADVAQLVPACPDCRQAGGRQGAGKYIK